MEEALRWKVLIYHNVVSPSYRLSLFRLLSLCLCSSPPLCNLFKSTPSFISLSVCFIIQSNYFFFFLLFLWNFHTLSNFGIGLFHSLPNRRSGLVLSPVNCQHISKALYKQLLLYLREGYCYGVLITALKCSFSYNNILWLLIDDRWNRGLLLKRNAFKANCNICTEPAGTFL